MSNAYDPKAYWESRLAAQQGLRGVGHISFGERYNEWLYRAKRRTLESALREIPLTGKTVLDVGAGTGYFVQWYIGRGARVCGVDIAQNAVERLRQLYDGDFRVADISAPHAPELGEYDVVNVWDVMYHIVDNDAFERALRFLVARVRRGGSLLITDRLGAPTDSLEAAHVRMRCQNTYQTTLASFGMEFIGLRFLYHWLNRHVFRPAIDSRLGPVFYWLDGNVSRIPADNLSLGLWRRME